MPKRKILPRVTWLQVTGDLSPEDYGGIFARGSLSSYSRDYDTVEILRIERKTDLVGADALTDDDPDAYWTSEAEIDRKDLASLWEGPKGQAVRDQFDPAMTYPDPRKCSLFDLACLASELAQYGYLGWDETSDISGHEISKRYRLRDYNGRSIRRAFKVGQREHDREVADHNRR
jgi:hypothetical protein